jgi:hypothetical protein
MVLLHVVAPPELFLSPGIGMSMQHVQAIGRYPSPKCRDAAVTSLAQLESMALEYKHNGAECHLVTLYPRQIIGLFQCESR